MKTKLPKAGSAKHQQLMPRTNWYGWTAIDMGHQQIRFAQKGKVWEVAVGEDNSAWQGESLRILQRRTKHQFSFKWPLQQLGWRVAVAVSAGTDRKTQQVWYPRLHSLGIGRIKEVSAPLAAAAGCGEDVHALTCRGVIGMGASSCWFATYALGQLVAWCELPLGGQHLSAAVQQYIGTRHDMQIPFAVAEAARLQMGSLEFTQNRSKLSLEGKDLRSGVEKTCILHDTELCEVLQDRLEPFLWSIREVMRTIPPEMLTDLGYHPVWLVGGVAHTAGTATFLHKQLQLTVKQSAMPEYAVVRGTLKLAQQHS